MATADLLIMIPILIGGTFFCVDSGLTVCYKQKMTAILIQAADYAVNLPAQQEHIVATENIVKALVKKNGLKVAALKVTVQDTMVESSEAVSVTASASFPLLQGSFLPVAVSLSDTATAMVPINRVCAAIAINPYPYSYENPEQNQSVYVPIIQPRNQLPIWQFPYDTAINNLHLVDGVAPTGPRLPSPYFAQRPSLY